MKHILGFIAFMVTWAAGCSLVDYCLPHLPNAYIMAIGFFTGKIGFFLRDRIVDTLPHRRLHHGRTEEDRNSAPDS